MTTARRLSAQSYSCQNRFYPPSKKIQMRWIRNKKSLSWSRTSTSNSPRNCSRKQKTRIAGWRAKKVITKRLSRSLSSGSCWAIRCPTARTSWRISRCNLSYSMSKTKILTKLLEYTSSSPIRRRLLTNSTVYSIAKIFSERSGRSLTKVRRLPG